MPPTLYFFAWAALTLSRPALAPAPAAEMAATVAALTSPTAAAPATDTPSREPAETPLEARRDSGPRDQATPPAPRRLTPPDADPAVVRLLDELEASGRTLEAFTANVHYETEDGFLAQRVIRKGDLLYHVDPGTRKKSFAIMFNVLIENRRKVEREKEYIFRDGWLVERDRAAKQFVKRQIVGPGEAFDPLKLGEGPIPLPIGQPRQEVLDRFRVESIELPGEGPLAKLRNVVVVDGLRLFPRPGTPEAEDYTHIDLYYDRATHLPAGIDLLEVNGDRKTARLDDIVRNPVIDAAALARIDIGLPEDAAAWHVDVRPLE